MKVAPLVKCSSCKGKGRTRLSRVLNETLQVLRDSDKPMKASEVLEILGAADVHPTAINNRLEDLRDFGLVSRKKEGNAFYYSAR